MSVSNYFSKSVQKALRRKRVLSDKERQKRVVKKGGFDTSKINKKTLAEIEKTFNVCFFCKQSTKAIADETHKTGVIRMTCNTPGCIGNVEEKEAEKKRTNPKLYGRIIDKKLCFDLGKMLVGRDPGRYMVTPQRIIL